MPWADCVLVYRAEHWLSSENPWVRCSVNEPEPVNGEKI